MPFRKLKLQPGVNLERTATLNNTNFAQSNLIRFYSGLPQKIGGWQRLTNTPFTGVARALHGWGDIQGNPYLAIGSDQFLEVLIGGSLINITPDVVVQTTNEPPAFATIVGSPIVTVTDPNYSPGVADWINITTQAAVGGLILFGLYQVVTTSDPTYTINAGKNASGITTNLYNDNGVLVVDYSAGYPAAVGTLAVGNIWSNGGVVSVVPGGTPSLGAAVYFGTIDAPTLLALGGLGLPTTPPTVGSLQLWNNSNEVWVA